MTNSSEHRSFLQETKYQCCIWW